MLCELRRRVGIEGECFCVCGIVVDEGIVFCDFVNFIFCVCVECCFYYYVCDEFVVDFIVRYYVFFGDDERIFRRVRF